ncbi:MFS transporter [Sphingomonas sp. AOB5]|uniref:MFS transporter n=1 Tax=Sphingomonas sp. AOB5 TaxID=3034017 RepID=UPI0023F6CDEB|nr:MFS transporter [Sphingomonas sp. AOB5]MDF7774763.1 MFS transporter [Sphingomonas sp. AOB5]
MTEERPSRAAWYVLVVLFLAYVCNVADRHILSILAQPVKQELQLSDWQVGLLIGPAIAFFYAIVGIPMAFVADRVHRVRFLAVCLGMWSLLTALGGAAGNAWQLALTRIGVSAVEAGGSPASSSIVADYFPLGHRPMAMGIFASAATIGLLMSFGLGGFGADHFGWRWTLVLAGAPGILLALLLIASVREPVRGAFDAQAEVRPPQPLLPTLGILWRNLLFRRAVLAVGVSNFCFHAIINWGPSLIIRKFYAGTGHAGAALGIGIALFGGVAAIVSGRAIGRMAADGIARPLRIAALLMLLSGPVMLAAVFAPRLELCVALMCLAYGLQSFSIPLYWTVAQSHVPPETRAMAAAILLLALAIVGSGIAAPVLGALSDRFQPWAGQASLQYALAAGTIMNLVCAALFWRASRAA